MLGFVLFQVNCRYAINARPTSHYRLGYMVRQERGHGTSIVPHRFFAPRAFQPVKTISLNKVIFIFTFYYSLSICIPFVEGLYGVQLLVRKTS